MRTRDVQQCHPADLSRSVFVNFHNFKTCSFVMLFVKFPGCCDDEYYNHDKFEKIIVLSSNILSVKISSLNLHKKM